MIDKIAIMNKARMKKRRVRDLEVKKTATELFEKYKNEPLFMSGIALYWAEGTRLNIYGRKFQLALTNSDSSLLKFYCKFLRAYFNNSFTVSDWRAELFLYPDIDCNAAISYWSSVLGVPGGQFIKPQILNGSLHNKKRLKFGTCCIYINSKDACITMEAWINCICDLMRR